MASVFHSTTQGGRAGASMATSSSRNHQRQRCAQTERGNGSLGLSAHTCVAGNDPQHNWPGNRAGHFGFAPSKTRGAMSRASHSHRLASSSPSRRPVLETLLGIGLHFPAERIRAARGGLYSVRVLGSTPSRAQSLANQHLHKLAVAKIHHLSNLSSGLTDLAISCATKGLGNVRKAFGEIRNV